MSLGSSTFMQIADHVDRKNGREANPEDVESSPSVW